MNRSNDLIDPSISSSSGPNINNFNQYLQQPHINNQPLNSLQQILNSSPSGGGPSNHSSSSSTTIAAENLIQAAASSLMYTKLERNNHDKSMNEDLQVRGRGGGGGGEGEYDVNHGNDKGKGRERNTGTRVTNVGGARKKRGKTMDDNNDNSSNVDQLEREEEVEKKSVSSRRAAQNRLAQKTFRERKEDLIKHLEGKANRLDAILADPNSPHYVPPIQSGSSTSTPSVRLEAFTPSAEVIWKEEKANLLRERDSMKGLLDRLTDSLEASRKEVEELKILLGRK